jgi:hypothetical protein
MRRLLVTLIGSLLLASGAASAQNAPPPPNLTAPNPTTPEFVTPDLVSVGIGYLGVIKFAKQVAAPDFRAEYRSGLSLVSLANPDWRYLDQYFQIHPAVGFEVTARGAIYAEYSFIVEAPITEHFFVGWDEGAGFYFPLGGEPRRGGSAEFRSQFETGWKFDNGVRLAGWFGHISNAHSNHTSFSGDGVGVYLHVPTTLLVQQ